MLDYIHSGSTEKQIANLSKYVGKSKSIRSYRASKVKTHKEPRLDTSFKEKRFNEVPIIKGKMSKTNANWKNKTMDEALNEVPKLSARRIASKQSVRSESIKTEIMGMLETLDEKELEEIRRSLLLKVRANKINDKSDLTEKNLKAMSLKDETKSKTHTITSESQYIY